MDQLTYGVQKLYKKMKIKLYLAMKWIIFFWLVIVKTTHSKKKRKKKKQAATLQNDNNTNNHTCIEWMRSHSTCNILPIDAFKPALYLPSLAQQFFLSMLTMTTVLFKLYAVMIIKFHIHITPKIICCFLAFSRFISSVAWIC